MFDEKMYKETYSALHASEKTLEKVMERINQPERKKNCRKHLYMQQAAVFAAVLVLGAAAASAAGYRQLGGWAYHTSGQDMKKTGFHYPKHIGEYRADRSSVRNIHVAPEQYSGIRAWFSPDYVWISLDYKKGRQKLSFSFGKTDDPLWRYCFGFDEDTGKWRGASEPEYLSEEYTDGTYHIENVSECSYRGCTVYLYDGVREYFSGKDHPDFDSADEVAEYPFGKVRDANALWTDDETGVCCLLASGWEWDEQGDKQIYMSERQGMGQEEMLGYVKEIIDASR